MAQALTYVATQVCVQHTMGIPMSACYRDLRRDTCRVLVQQLERVKDTPTTVLALFDAIVALVIF